MKRLLGFAVIVIAALNVLFCILALARNDWYASSSGTVIRTLENMHRRLQA
ncbi:hypothetical protein DPMN_079881 [Dreissena polymorpha]|uniref:Uncharacterized protein n=1 Tax=Dreissena polymorpha TaxID=45954 RepID=A0A9D4BIR0_DREPO|nr:hypothetical protein DPMN_079881 [Dreissena polymorpha]